MYTSLKWLPHGKCNPSPSRSREALKESEMANELDKDEYVTGTLDDSEDEEDFSINPTDCILASVSLEDEDSVLEFHLYDGKTGSLYVHHDIPIPSIPIQVCYLDRLQSEQLGNFVAVCGYKETIDIFDVDVLDCLEPAISLPSNHKGATISMDWNSFLPNILLSGGDDSGVQMHDLFSGKTLPSLKDFPTKVEHLQWSPQDASLYALSGGTQTEVRDGRQVDSVLTLRFSSESESMSWFPGQPFFLLTALDDGKVLLHDRRKSAKPLWTLQAHNEACTSISLFSTTLATTSLDGFTKLWSIDGVKPRQRDRKQMNIGPLLCSSYENENEILAVGGEKSLALWDKRN